jgi:hypothetical protein
VVDGLTPLLALLTSLVDGCSLLEPPANEAVDVIAALAAAPGGCDVGATAFVSDEQQGALRLACDWWDDRVVRALLEAGADISPRQAPDLLARALRRGCGSLLRHPALTPSADCWFEACDWSTAAALMTRGVSLPEDAEERSRCFGSALFDQRVDVALIMARLDPSLAAGPMHACHEPTLHGHAAWLVRVHAFLHSSCDPGRVLAAWRDQYADSSAAVSTEPPRHGVRSVLLRAMAHAFDLVEAAAAGGGDPHSSGNLGLTPAQVVAGCLAPEAFPYAEGPDEYDDLMIEFAHVADEVRWKDGKPGMFYPQPAPNVSTRLEAALASAGLRRQLPDVMSSTTPGAWLEAAAVLDAGFASPDAALWLRTPVVPAPPCGDAAGALWLAALGRGAWSRRRAAVVAV